jgi:hypothetical protein
VLFNLLCRRLGEKRITKEELPRIELDLAIAMSLMEKAFSPSFFVIQTHLVSHLSEEIRIHGLFAPCSMYP